MDKNLLILFEPSVSHAEVNRGEAFVIALRIIGDSTLSPLVANYEIEAVLVRGAGRRNPIFLRDLVQGKAVDGIPWFEPPRIVYKDSVGRIRLSIVLSQTYTSFALFVSTIYFPAKRTLTRFFDGSMWGSANGGGMTEGTSNFQFLTGFVLGTDT